MALNQPCVNCGQCCVEVCQADIRPRCECCNSLNKYPIAPNMSLKSGQAVAVNALCQLVPFNPNAPANAANESPEFIGINRYYVTSNAEGQITNYGTNHPFAQNPCPPNRAYVWLCGIFRNADIAPYGNLSGLDIVRGIVAQQNRAFFLPCGNSDTGEFKLL